MSRTLRGLPAVHRVLQDPSIAPYELLVGRDALREAVRDVLDRARAADERPGFETIVAQVACRADALAAEALLPAINGTGVLLHTNLGRAPIAAEALAHAAGIGSGYSNLEYDLIAGERGSRYARVSGLLCELTGARAALLVNNCAAAVLLILDTFARDREVVVARSQLIEIGGGFRISDVLERSGASLVEVGATNKVYVEDYERALSARTALLMRTHSSNYRIEGFTHEVSGDELVALGRRAGIPVVEDLGSGALVDLREYGLPRERTVQDAVAEGVSLVAFSGDKLLGGPQAGIIVGSEAHVARLRSNPLIRALRVDKIGIALLDATLRLYRSPESRATIPLYRMLGVTLEELRARGERYVAAVPSTRIVESVAYAGGGSLPGSGIASIAIALPGGRALEYAAHLRNGRPPIIARIEDGAVLLDLRTIPPEHDATVSAALQALTDREL